MAQIDAEEVKPMRELRGYLEIEDEELKFFTKRFFELNKERDVLEYYKQDPKVRSWGNFSSDAP